MEQEKRGPDEADEQPENAATEAQDAADETMENADTGSGDDQAAVSEIEALRAENIELKDKSLRLIAEMENLRRRTEREKSDFSKYAISEFARDILSVGDNIRRAIEAIPADAASSHPVLRSLVEGVEVTERELLKVLEKYQIKRFDPQGEVFNPHLHDAMTKIDVPNVAADTIVQVLHAGYMIGERVLRPAAVIVAKGGGETDSPKSSNGEKNEAQEESLPPGAMKVPEDIDSVLSSQDAPPASKPKRPDVQTNVLGREFQTERRRQSSSGQGAEERVAPFRRPRSAAGDQSYGEVRQQGGQGPSKPSTLHKPVISSGKD